MDKVRSYDAIACKTESGDDDGSLCRAGEGEQKRTCEKARCSSGLSCWAICRALRTCAMHLCGWDAASGIRQRVRRSCDGTCVHKRVVLLAGLRPGHVVVVLHKENRVPLNDQRHALLIQEKKSITDI